MRAYDDSMNGIVSGNSTPYSGQAGITRAITYDPSITSVRGYIPKTDPNTLNAANMLSPTELLSSFTAAGADSPRQAGNSDHVMAKTISSEARKGTFNDYPKGVHSSEWKRETVYLTEDIV